MAIPTSIPWDRASFDEATLGSLLTLGPGDIAITPAVSPYFSYTDDFRTLVARSSDGVAAQFALDVGVPGRFTLEFVARFPSLPQAAADLEGHRVGLTVADDAGRGVSLYFATTGLAVSRVDDFGSVAVLPDTAADVREVAEGFKTFRVAVDSALGRAYVYIGDGDTRSPTFRYIVPVEATPETVPDTFAFFVKGSAAQPVQLELRRLQLAGDLLIPNFPPVADAGPDRVAAVGQSIRLDGRGSFDLEGAPLSYDWSVIDAPLGSSFAAEVSSGNTVDDGNADGFTPLLSFAPNTLPGWVGPDDVLVIGGSRHVILTVDNSLGVLTVRTNTIPDTLTDTPFRLLRQSLLVGAQTETPYAVPDVQGVYRFELVVSDGETRSEASEVLANIVGARTPFGIEPDVSPIWKALGDEWQFIEGRQIFEEGWRAAAQLLGAKLLEAWQYHYNFSIRDAQGLLQRKWVPFRSLVAETDPDSVEISARYGILQANHPFELGAPAVTGLTLVFEYADGDGLDTTASVEVVLTGDALDQIIADCNAALLGTGISAFKHAVRQESLVRRYDGADGATADDGDGDRVTALFSFTPNSLPSWVAPGDTLLVRGHRHTILTVDNPGGELTLEDESLPDDLGTNVEFRIWRNSRLAFKAPGKAFRLRASSSAAAPLGVAVNRYNLLEGTNGAIVTDRTYFAGDGVNLAELGVQRGDMLVLNNGQSFLIDRVFSGGSDAQENQRILLFEELPFDASATWTVPSVVVSTAIDYEREAVYPGDVVKLEVFDLDARASDDRTAIVIAQREKTLAVQMDQLYGALRDPERFELRLLGVKRRKAIPLEASITSIPQLQDLIPVSAGPTRWQENVHYVLEPFYRESDGSPMPMLQFRDSTFIDPDLEPPDLFWAELVFYSNAPNVENLFGRLVGFLQEDAAAYGRDFNYTAGVAGLMYSQQRGPRVRAIEVGATILFGQPFAEVNGIITEIRPDFSPTKGRMIVQDDDGERPSRSEIYRTYFYKKNPLDMNTTSGLSDNPKTGLPWAEGEEIAQFSPIGAGVDVVDLYTDPKWYYPFVRAGLMTELEKFHTFVVRFNPDLITLANLSLLYQFVMRARPSYTHPIILGRREVLDDLDVTDSLDQRVTMHIQTSLCGSGPAFVYDDIRGDGTYWMLYNGAQRYDHLVDCPLDTIFFTLTDDWVGGALTYDSIFHYGVDVIDTDGAFTGIPGNTFPVTYDMTLPAGTYQVVLAIKPGGTLP